MPACAGARVEAILQQDGASEKNLIEIILCKVTDEGTVLLDDHVATASLDIRRSLCTHCNTLHDGRDTTREIKRESEREGKSVYFF